MNSRLTRKTCYQRRNIFIYYQWAKYKNFCSVLDNHFGDLTNNGDGLLDQEQIKFCSAKRSKFQYLLGYIILKFSSKIVTIVMQYKLERGE